MIQKLKGTKDIIPGEIEKWQYVESQVSDVMKIFNYSEIRVPVIEATELFQRGVGETTDVVQKEMYTFEDKGGRSVSLRPEGTAGVVRAYIEDGLSSMPSPLKLYYRMNVYRYENVQKGRQREFNQFGVEVLGSSSPDADIEVIATGAELLRRLNINNTALMINSIGCKECRQKYQEALKDFIRPNLDKYCDTCKTRFEKNPMRILDCKDENDKKMNEGAPRIIDFLCDDCKAHLERVKKGLEELGIEYTIDSSIVRGLDYYTRTVFEFVSKIDGLTVIGGGRYDGLVEELGGPATPAVGFGIGEERLISVFEAANPDKDFKSNIDIFVASIGEDANSYAQKIVNELRKNDVKAAKDIMDRGIKAQFKYADRINAKYVLTIGDNEIAEKKAQLKDMSTGETESVDILDSKDILSKIR